MAIAKYYWQGLVKGKGDSKNRIFVFLTINQQHYHQ